MFGAVAERPTSVTLDFSGVDDRTYARIDGLALEREAIARLLQEGFAVVPKQTAAQVTVRTRSTTDGLLHVEAAHAQPRSARATTANAELHLEVLQHIVAVARESAAFSAPSPPVVTSLEPPPAVKMPTVTAAEPTPRVFALSVATVGLGRLGGFDGRLLVSAAVRWHAWSFEALGGWTPSGASRLAIHEFVAAAVVWVNHAFGARWSVALGAGAGVAFHSWSSGLDQDLAPRGTRIEPTFRVPALVAFHFNDSLSLGLLASWFTTLHGLAHVVGDSAVWARGAMGGELGVRFESAW